MWNIFCDWYVELTKPLLQGEDGPAKIETRACTAFVLDQIYALLHPFMPFITEELWAIKGEEGEPAPKPLTLASWPSLEEYEDAAAEGEVGWIVELISEVRSLRAEMNLRRRRRSRWSSLARKASGGTARAMSDTLQTAGAPFRRLVRRGAAQKQRADFRARHSRALPLEGVIDFSARSQRLDKEIEKLEGEAKKLDAKLANPGFLAKAEEEVIDEHRERLEATRARVEKLRAARGRLG